MIAASFAVGLPAFLLSTIDYSFLWRYVGFSNQILATVMLWVSVSYLLRYGKKHLVAGIPALFMTAAIECICIICTRRIIITISNICNWRFNRIF